MIRKYLLAIWDVEQSGALCWGAALLTTDGRYGLFFAKLKNAKY